MSRRAAPESLDLCLSSAATCAGLYVLVCCQGRGIPTEDFRLEQRQVIDDGTLRRIQLRVLLPVGFADTYVAGVQAVAAGCRITKTSVDGPEVEVIAVPAAPVAATA